MKHISLFITKTLILFITVGCFAQSNAQLKDSVVIKQRYGLRMGTDLAKIIRTLVESDYEGLEFNFDYRLTKNLYLAGDFGNETRITDDSEFLNITTEGNYLKLGIDYNVYTNWLDMDNLIYAGFRIGYSDFEQQLNSFTVYNTDQYWQEPFTNDIGKTFSGLSASWAELQVGLKAELIRNLYMGINIQFKGRIHDDDPENFENVYIPGFNKTYDSGSFGIGFGYNIQYLIPFYKKANKPKAENTEN